MNLIPDPPFSQTGIAAGPALHSCVPRLPMEGIPSMAYQNHALTIQKNSRPDPAKREPALTRDMFLELRLGDMLHVISESYAYKTESYYSILRHELDGEKVMPASSAILDASVVPLCLERARLAKIPVCDWGISQGYVPLPSILYGLNYFASTAAYCIVHDEKQAKEAVRHLTNCGKYPVCYQKIPAGATISTCTSVFGKTAGTGDGVAQLARQVYDLFGIPLVTLVIVADGDSCRLSSLAPTRYCRLSPAERSLLLAYLNHQEFL